MIGAKFWILILSAAALLIVFSQGVFSLCESGCNPIPSCSFSCTADGCCGDWQYYCFGDGLYKKRECCFNSSSGLSYFQVAFVQWCANGCSNGECNEEEPECVLDSDCGTNGYVGQEYCQNNNVYQDYKSFTCSNDVCSSSTEKKLKENCKNGCSNGECKEKDEECSDTTKVAEEELCGNGYCDVDVGEDESNCPEDCLKTLSQTQSYSSNTIYQLSHSDSADVKEDSVKQNPAVNSQMFVPAILLALTAILIIILAVVLIAG